MIAWGKLSHQKLKLKGLKTCQKWQVLCGYYCWLDSFLHGKFQNPQQSKYLQTQMYSGISMFLGQVGILMEQVKLPDFPFESWGLTEWSIKAVP